MAFESHKDMATPLVPMDEHEYTVVDGLADILIRAFENQGTSFKDNLEITTRASGDKTAIQDFHTVPKTTQHMVTRYHQQKKSFTVFDRHQKETRATLSDQRQELDSMVYEHLVKHCPETLEDEYKIINEETGEEEVYKVMAKQTTKKRNVPKSDIKQFVRESIEETLSKTHPRMKTDTPFNKKSCSVLVEDAFVESFYDTVSTKIQERSDELQSFVTEVTMVKKGGYGKKNSTKDGDMEE